MGGEKRSRSRSWPTWLEPLRPDDVSRARMRSAVLERARPWLERRRAASTWELAEAAARRLAPLAACAVLLFGWMAHRADPPPIAADRPLAPEPAAVRTGASNVAVEELVRSTRPQGPPAVLTSASAPSRDLVLAATLRGQD